MKIHKRLNDLRHDRQLSVAELAEKANLSTAYVYRLEEGKHVPSDTTLRKLASALDVELFELLGVSEDEMKRSALRSKIGGMSLSQVEAVTNMIESFLK